jgi:hypothetical protein
LCAPRRITKWYPFLVRCRQAEAFGEFSEPPALGSNDHHSYSQNLSVQVGGKTYNLCTTVSISDGNFSGTPQDNMRNFLLLSSSVLLAVALPSPPRISGQGAQAPQEDVLAHPASIGDAPLPIFSAFQSALQISGVPGGAAFVEGCSDQPVPMARVHGITLREVLNSITAGDSAYTWKMREGVVNFEPSTGLPALLKVHLNNYESGDASDAVSAVTFLSSSPEVTSAATKLGLAQNVLGPGLGSMVQGPPPPKKNSASDCTT